MREGLGMRERLGMRESLGMRLGMYVFPPGFSPRSKVVSTLMLLCCSVEQTCSVVIQLGLSPSP